MKYGVYDTNMKIRPDRIIVGAVSSSQCLNEFNTWLGAVADIFRRRRTASSLTCVLNSADSTRTLAFRLNWSLAMKSAALSEAGTYRMSSSFKIGIRG
jgi:hypothetical protein